MTKKDYDLIAACLGAAYVESRNDIKTINDISLRIRLELGLQNPKFDDFKFLARIDYWKAIHSNTL